MTKPLRVQTGRVSGGNRVPITGEEVRLSKVVERRVPVTGGVSTTVTDNDTGQERGTVNSSSSVLRLDVRSSL